MLASVCDSGSGYEVSEEEKEEPGEISRKCGQQQQQQQQQQQ